MDDLQAYKNVGGEKERKGAKEREERKGEREGGREDVRGGDEGEGKGKHPEHSAPKMPSMKVPKGSQQRMRCTHIQSRDNDPYRPKSPSRMILQLLAARVRSS